MQQCHGSSFRFIGRLDTVKWKRRSTVTLLAWMVRCWSHVIRIPTMPKTRLGLGGHDHGLTLSCALFWVLELVGRTTRVLVSTQARVMALREMTSESDLDNVKHGRRQWSKEHLESTCISIVICAFVLLISNFFLVPSHHFDCFSAASSCRLLS